MAHMPLYYLLDSRPPQWTTNRAMQIFLRVAACLVLLAVVSELVRRIVGPADLRTRLFGPAPRLRNCRVTA